MTTRQFRFMFAATLLTLALSGCGSKSDRAPAVSAAGKHPSDWYNAHRQAYSREYLADNARQCRDCHGQDLMGGITGIGCSTTSCHANGHPPRPIPHAIPFTSPNQHGPAAKADLVWCQTCHGQAGGAGTNPRFNVSIGSLPHGCEASGCHNRANPAFASYSAAHPRPWSLHNTAGNLLNACGLCHGATLLGGAGRSCQSCHTRMAAGVPPVYGDCLSCHAQRSPSSGSHPGHLAVASLAGLCSACHSGAGYGTPAHSRRGFANVSTAIPLEFNAKSGAARIAVSGSSVTCANVSCHGGITTPAWGLTIDAASQCALCHAPGTASQTPQYNSYWSGEHAKHVSDIGVPCYDCHDMTVSNSGHSHFGNMATPAFELAPALTIRSQVNYAGGSCSPGVNPPGFQFTNCHTSKDW